MTPCILPQDEIYWYIHPENTRSLRTSIEADVAIIGGGMAGLSAAQAFRKKGFTVVLIEKNFCGAGATGKSSGFVTPDSELSLGDLFHFYERDGAKKLWEFVAGGVDQIKNNILTFNLDCDYQIEDTLIIASSERSFKKLIGPEYRYREQLGYPSVLYNQHELPAILGSQKFHGGIAYGNSFGISGYQYCQAMKRVLCQQGVEVYESSPAIKLDDHTITTPYGSVKADHIIVCTDQAIPWLSSLTHQVYHVETFLMMSIPLADAQIKRIFPANKYMVWDTNLIYNYFRMTGDNRLMIGGSDLWYTYAQTEDYNSEKIIKKLARYITETFHGLDITFEYVWPGMLGVSKDFLPIAGRDIQKPFIYYILAATGLPWAAALGGYSAEAVMDKRQDFDHYFSPYRDFTVGSGVQSILGTRLTFALSHLLRSGSF